jgi:hypothetical protein
MGTMPGGKRAALDSKSKLSDQTSQVTGKLTAKEETTLWYHRALRQPREGRKGNAKVTKLLRQYRVRESHILRCLGGGREPVIKLLIAKGADVNIASKGGFTALYAAAQDGHEPVIKLLIAEGADVNAANKNGFTPLYVAALNSHDSIVELLIVQGAYMGQLPAFATTTGTILPYRRRISIHEHLRTTDRPSAML